MNINYKRSLKFLTLLIMSILIATVSASTYYTMFLHSHNIGVDTGNKVYFTQGSDWTGTSAMGDGNQTVTLDSLKGGNGTAATIRDPLRIYNNDTTDHTINLKLDSWDGNSQGQLNYINVTLYDAVPTGGNAKGQTIYLLPGGSGQVNETGTQTITSGSTWRVEWVIYWKSTAVSQTVNVDLKIEVN